jgi:hypothetical protein
VPFWFINYFELSVLGNFFMDNIIYSLLSGFILIYFIIFGLYYYNVKIDSYVIHMTSFRPIFDFFNEKDYVDISHAMLADFEFFNRPFSLNRTLMLKINTNSGKRIIKRFNLSLLSVAEYHKITSVLESIIIKNK